MLGLQTLTAVSMKKVQSHMKCAWKRTRRFGEIFQIRKVNRRRSDKNQTKTERRAGFLFFLRFNPENGDDMSLRNVWLSTNCKLKNPEDGNLQTINK
jgi:hypothetical protein